MGLARVMCCLLIVCGMACCCAAPAGAEDLKAELQKAEANLAHAADTDPSHGNTATDPLSIDPDLAIFTFVVFVLLLAVLKKFAWGPILHALESREHNIASHIAQAERNHEEAKVLLAQYERKLADAANEVRQMLEEARRDAEATKQAILAEGKAAADAERARSLHDIEAATDAAMETLAERSAQLAVELAGKILQARLTSEDHSRLIQDAMTKFTATSKN